MSWKDMLEIIVPPEGQVHDRRWYAWASFGVFTFWFYMWWSLGLMDPAFGGGFARAEDSKLNTQLILESRLLETKRNQCRSADGTAKSYYTQEIIRLKNLYLEKIGFTYNEPPCSAVIVTTASSTDE